FTPTDRSNFANEEFADELAHIISPPEYDRFYFRKLPDPGELISILNSGIRENPPSTTRVNLPVEDDYSPLLTYVVWICLAYLTYPVIPPYLHSFRNEDTIFDPVIIINRFYSFKPVLSHRCGSFKKFNTHRSHLNESNTTIHSDISLLDYEAFSFYDDHIEEISSGSTTTHSDISLFVYDSFIFDLSNDQFPPTDRSDFTHEEFADELAHIISPPEYDCFLFKVKPNLRDFTKDVVEDISPTKEPQVHNALSTHPNLQLNMKFQPSSEYLFTYVVWIFLPFLVYSVAPVEN
nr:hypothetical protein [Tanacetum cinerariifolium]